MATAGPNNPGTIVSDNTIGGIAWTNPSNAASSNNVYATVSLSDEEHCEYLKATNFGFSIPSGTINGITVAIERKRIKETTDFAVRLVKAGVIGSTDRSTATIYTGSDVSENHGGVADLWGTTWTPSEINSSTFGVAYSAVDTEGSGSSTLSCDVITVTITYTEGGTTYTETGSGGALASTTTVTPIKAYMPTVSGGTLASTTTVTPTYRFNPTPIGGSLVSTTTVTPSLKTTPTLTGGALASTTVVSPMATYNPSVSGGGLGGGIAIWSITFLPEGGALIGGIADSSMTFLPDGGGLAGETADVFAELFESTTGGAIVGGIASEETAISADGSALAGGVAEIQTELFGFPESGAITGGIADSSITVQPDGGALASGASNSSVGVGIFGGSVVASGSVDLNAIYTTTQTGGTLANGIATIVKTSTLVASGGALVGGAVPISVYQYVPRDGEIAVTGFADAEMHTSFYNIELTSGDPDIAVAGNSTTAKTYFGIEANPIFSFGRRTFPQGVGTSKKQACYGFTVSQRTVLASATEAGRILLERIDPDSWHPISFNPKKKEACVQINTPSITNLITIDLIV